MKEYSYFGSKVLFYENHLKKVLPISLNLLKRYSKRELKNCYEKQPLKK